MAWPNDRSSGDTGRSVRPATIRAAVASRIQRARRDTRHQGFSLLRDDTLLPSREEAPTLSHPWLAGSEAFGPAKTRQIAGVIDSVSRHGPSLLTETIDVRHPFCAQPVIEACLAIPTALLTIGGVWSARRSRTGSPS